METLKQAIRYGVVGLSNTLITAVVIWVMMKMAGCSDVVSNIIGYTAGVLNSFVWNKRWTFKSSVGWTQGAINRTIYFHYLNLCTDLTQSGRLGASLATNCHLTGQILEQLDGKGCLSRHCTWGSW